MKIGFTKMHGCGNDYIYVNGAEAAIDERKKKGLYGNLATGILASEAMGLFLSIL